MGKGFKGFIVAGAIGATLGVLFAPRKGKETRKLLSQKTDSIWGEEAQKKGTIMGEVAKTTKSAVEAGQNIFTNAQKTKFNAFKNEAAAKGQKIFHDTTTFIQDFSKDNIRPVFSEKNEELRKKIDIAREKITSEVDNTSSSASKKKVTKKKVVKAAPKKAAQKKSTAKASAKTAAKKPVPKKAPAKKAPAKKAPAKKTTAKKATTKKAAPKKAAVKKATPKKTTAKRTATKKSTRK